MTGPGNSDCDDGAMSPPSAPGARRRAPRSDALANRDRLLAVATVVLRRDGLNVPIATIAEAAGLGVGTFYRHYPNREALLAALQRRSLEIVLANVAAALECEGTALDAIALYLGRSIDQRDGLLLPLNGGPALTLPEAIAMRTRIGEGLTAVLERGRVDGSVRSDVTAVDLVMMAAMLAQPLPHVPDWDTVARREAAIYLAGLAATQEVPLEDS